MACDNWSAALPDDGSAVPNVLVGGVGREIPSCVSSVSQCDRIFSRVLCSGSGTNRTAWKRLGWRQKAAKLDASFDDIEGTEMAAITVICTQATSKQETANNQTRAKRTRTGE